MNYHTGFHSEHASLQSHELWVSDSLSLHPHWHKLPFVLLVLGILENHKVVLFSFLWKLRILTIFRCSWAMWVSSDINNTVSICIPLFNLVVLMVLWFWILYKFWILALYHLCVEKNLSLFCSLPLCPNGGVLCHTETFQFMRSH